jgi:hypothetical protein
VTAVSVISVINFGINSTANNDAIPALVCVTKDKIQNLLSLRKNENSDFERELFVFCNTDKFPEGNKP